MKDQNNEQEKSKLFLKRIVIGIILFASSVIIGQLVGKLYNLVP